MGHSLSCSPVCLGAGWSDWAHLPLPSLCPWQVPAVCVLRRSPEGAPVQVFVPENGEIISQV